ncbi:hypothetical protein [Geobacter sp.]|uniref:hypothetical protein n=1 Tax=Geobacter sp. TaxID=46610 RepID=UPI0027BACF6B|nr:hypothetical protein [Geobacter sp.]
MISPTPGIMAIKLPTLYLLIFNLFNAFLGLLCLYDPGFFADAYLPLFLFSGLVLCWNMFDKFRNILFLSRTFFLAVIGYFPMAVKVFAGPNALFSAWEPRSQDFSVVIIMYALTSMALLANEVGLRCGRLFLHYDQATASAELEKKGYDVLFWVSLLLVAMIGFQFASQGQLITSEAYSLDYEKTFLGLGNYNAIGAIMMMTALLSIKRDKSKVKLVLLTVVAGYYLIWGILLRGARQDVITPILGCYIVYFIADRKLPVISKKTFAVCVFVFWFGLTFGRLRMSAMSNLSFKDVFVLFTYMKDRALESDMYDLDFISAISTTFSNTIYMIQNNFIGFSYGESYLDFILRTPPKFLYPDRPEDLALLFENHGLITGGGVFELAEGYLNFGILGALIVPFVISFVISRFFWQALFRQSLWRYFLLFAFLSVWLRGALYQTFAYYKSIITAMIMYVGLKILLLVMEELKTCARPRARTLEKSSGPSVMRISENG